MDPLLNYHPVAVHFPIVLLILAILFQIGEWTLPTKGLEKWTLIIVTLGSLGALLSGLLLHPHAFPEDLPDKAVKVFEDHEFYAELTQWFSVVSVLLKGSELYFKRYARIMKGLTTLFLAACALTVSFAGHYGGQLVYEHGIGVKGQYLDRKEQ